MEKGSSSFGISSGSSDSLNGLKFGQKIYFEDVGTGENSTAAPPPEEEAGAAPASSKKGRGGGQGGNPPRCQVEGCKVDLTGAKAYYCRHKVCGMHSKTPKVVVAGLEQRFCQQCSRFHQLAEFDQGKRSCRRRLAGHNQRRRKAPPTSLLSSCLGRMSSSLPEDVSRVGGILDFSHPMLPGRNLWSATRTSVQEPNNQVTATGKYLQNLLNEGFEGSSGSVLTHVGHPYSHSLSGGTIFPSSEIPAGSHFAGHTDSGCALSLLSTQPWGARGRPSDHNNLMQDNIPRLPQSTPHATLSNNLTNNNAFWSLKDGGGSSEGLQQDMALDQIQEPMANQLRDQPDFTHQARRQYADVEQTSSYASTSHQMSWSL